MKRISFCKIFIILILLSANTVVTAQSKVLIVSTDRGVYRYEKIASEFKNILQQNAYQWSEFDLGDSANTENRLKQTIEQQNPDIIYCIGTKAYSLARQYAGDKKLLFSAAINWRRLGISEGTYGVANELSPIQEISLLRYFFPSVNKIGLLYNKKYSAEYVETIKIDAATLNVQIIEQQITNPQEISSTLNELLPQVDMFWVISDPIVLSNKESVQQIFISAKQLQKPVYAYSDIFIKYGAVLAISADLGTIGRQSANLVMMIEDNKIPIGTVQIPAGSSISLNMCSIESMKMDFNKDALDSVNKIINCNE